MKCGPVDPVDRPGPARIGSGPAACLGRWVKESGGWKMFPSRRLTPSITLYPPSMLGTPPIDEDAFCVLGWAVLHIILMLGRMAQ